MLSYGLEKYIHPTNSFSNVSKYINFPVSKKFYNSSILPILLPVLKNKSASSYI